MAASELVHDNDDKGAVIDSNLVYPPPSPASSPTIDASPAVTEITIPKGHTDRLPNEWWKTGLTLLYAVVIGVLTAVTLNELHETMPDQLVSPPLPDKFFKYFDVLPWGIIVTEVTGLTLVALWAVQVLFLKHKSIISRRFLFLLSTLYMYRCVIMYITVLPVPPTIVCSPKLHNDTTAKFWRVVMLMLGGGMASTGNQMCGDYLYSGHTAMLTLLYLFIKEYSPPSMWWYHWMCWLLSTIAIIFILFSRAHYSIDIVIAYYFTTRIFWVYHELANTHALKLGPSPYLSRTWWYPVFNFLERNVQTTVPLVFSRPSFLSRKQRHSMEEGGGQTNESESASTLSHHWRTGDGEDIRQRDETFSGTVP